MPHKPFRPSVHDDRLGHAGHGQLRRQRTNSCYFTLAAVDANGKPVAVPPLKPSTPDERRRCEAARMRKQLRQEVEQRFNAMKQAAVHNG